MITIEPPPTKHNFPALDFKFQNSGHATAVLWKFGLVVEHVEIDPQPVFSGRVWVENAEEGQLVAGRTRILRPSQTSRTLCAAIANQGWGTALDCTLTLSSPTLDLLFPLDARQVNVSIPGGATYDLLVHHAALNQDEFAKLAELSREQARTRFESELPDLVERAARIERTELRSTVVKTDADARDLFLSTPENRRRYLEDPSIRERFRARTMEDDFDEVIARRTAEDRIRTEFDQKWKSRCSVSVQELKIQYELRDERGRRFSGSVMPHMGGNIGGDIKVFSDGFVHEEHFASFCISEPDTIYSCIIDVDRGTHSKEYPISRVVPSGDAEHFHIVVGATKSCHLRIKFQFHVDKATVVESKSFFLELWNPRNAGWHGRYKDGDAVRSLAKAAAVKSSDDLSWDELDALRAKAALEAFPFSASIQKSSP